MWGDFSRNVWYLHLAWHACSLSQLDELVKQRGCAPLSWMKPNRTFWTLVVEGLCCRLLHDCTALYTCHAVLHGDLQARGHGYYYWLVGGGKATKGTCRNRNRRRGRSRANGDSACWVHTWTCSVGTYSSSRVFIAIAVIDQSSLVRIGQMIVGQSTNT